LAGTFRPCEAAVGKAHGPGRDEDRFFDIALSPGK
jgi:hypothetical protein